jgi:L-fuconate dehydratase
LCIDFAIPHTQEELVRSTTFRYITDVITPAEALTMLKANENGKKERERKVREIGYPAYVTSAGWLGMIILRNFYFIGLLIHISLVAQTTAYPDDKISRLTKEALAHGFNHFKIKVGANQADDLRRGKLIRSLIDDPALLPPGAPKRDINSPDLKGKNAGPTGSVLMIDANQVWEVQQAIDYVKGLEAIKPW